MRDIKRKLAAFFGTFASSMLVFAPSVAAATVPVYGNDLAASGWEQSTTDGGTVTFEAADDAPLGDGVAKLTTTASNESRARLTTNNHEGTPLADVETLSYATKVTDASCDCGSVSMYVRIDVDGDLATTDDQTALVHEPYWQNDGSPDPAPVEQGVWQTWDVDSGLFWSSTTTDGFVAGAGGPPFYTLDDARELAPNAVVVDLGVYIGSFNPEYVTYADAVTFNDTTYDFEVSQPMPTTKDDCKKNGWTQYNGMFRNQGDCVSFVATQGRNQPGLANNPRF